MEKEIYSLLGALLVALKMVEQKPKDVIAKLNLMSGSGGRYVCNDQVPISQFLKLLKELSPLSSITDDTLHIGIGVHGGNIGHKRYKR
jgi:hypothetical protein